MEENYLELHALKVKQPLGDFYVISISARQLLDISFSEPLRYIDTFGNVKGNQRVKDEKRLKEIARYIDSVEMAFPNSIILSVNYTPQGFITKDSAERWRVVEETEDGLCKIIAPKKVKLAAIIDGQHRLNAFEFVQNPDRFTDLQLTCSVYFDLPNSYQAFLFATINSNQKRVSRSLALDQFGYNVDDEPEKAWTPEKLAVFLSRRLNIDKENSPFYQHVKVAPLGVEKLFNESIQTTWTVSTATIVDGICGLISTNPKRDRVLMQQKHFLSGRSRELLSDVKDTSPLRASFISQQDKTIYDTLIRYFKSVEKNLWQKSVGNSYIVKTVGIQATFDILKAILRLENPQMPSDVNFDKYLEKASRIDFADKFFQSSGIGRGRIRNSIGLIIGVIEKEKIKQKDLPFYEQILSNEKTAIVDEKWIWDEEAENAVVNALEKAEWNFDSRTVGLYLAEDHEQPSIFRSYAELFSKLVEIAEAAFSSALPSDPDFAETERDKFDPDDLVKSCLFEHETNLRKIAWI